MFQFNKYQGWLVSSFGMRGRRAVQDMQASSATFQQSVKAKPLKDASCLHGDMKSFGNIRRFLAHL